MARKPARLNTHEEGGTWSSKFHASNPTLTSKWWGWKHSLWQLPGENRSLEKGTLWSEHYYTWSHSKEQENKRKRRLKEGPLQVKTQWQGPALTSPQLPIPPSSSPLGEQCPWHSKQNYHPAAPLPGSWGGGEWASSPPPQSKKRTAPQHQPDEPIGQAEPGHAGSHEREHCPLLLISQLIKGAQLYTFWMSKIFRVTAR